MRPRQRRRLLVAIVLGSVALAGGCGNDATEAFCERARATRDAGPLFPDRIDGARVADPGAMAALEELGEQAPADIADDVAVLVAEARALVAEVESRDRGSIAPPARVTRPSRKAVEASQRAVFEYAALHCELDLSDPGEPN